MKIMTVVEDEEIPMRFRATFNLLIDISLRLPTQNQVTKSYQRTDDSASCNIPINNPFDSEWRKESKEKEVSPRRGTFLCHEMAHFVTETFKKFSVNKKGWMVERSFYFPFFGCSSV